MAAPSHRDPLVDELRALLGADGVLTPASDLARYETGWRYGRGKARCVVRPRDARQTAEALRACHGHGARVVAQGANTGLVAASTPDPSGAMVVLATERMCPPIEVDPANRTALVGAGVTLSALQAELLPHGLSFPIDLGADPQIGGMVATNTGGARLLRFGDVRANVLGLEVVLGDGTVLDRLRGLRKDNTGLDSRQLFIGTSGAFGVITRAVLDLAPLPAQRAAAMVGCPDGEAVLALLAALEHEAGELLSAFEVMGAEALRPVYAGSDRLRNPFGPRLPRYSVLVELATAVSERWLPLDDVLAGALAGTPVGADAVVAPPDALWAIRHSISESLRGEGRLLAFDVSVPRSRLPAFTRAAATRLQASWSFARLCDYGHWGDGGTHLVLVWRDEDSDRAADEVIAAMQESLYDLAVREFGGSYSAEHGIGPHNQRFFDRYADAPTRSLAAALAARCDPDGLLGTVRLW